MAVIIRASEIPSETAGAGGVRSRLVDDRVGVASMTLDRITLEPAAHGPEIMGKGNERFLYVIRGGGSAGDLPLEPETMVWLEAGDRLQLHAGDEGLEILLAGAGGPADGPADAT